MAERRTPTRQFDPSQESSQSVRDDDEASSGSEEEQEEYYDAIEPDNRGYRPSPWSRPTEPYMHGHAGPVTEVFTGLQAGHETSAEQHIREIYAQYPSCSYHQVLQDPNIHYRYITYAVPTTGFFHPSLVTSQIVRGGDEATIGSEEEQEEYYDAIESDSRVYRSSHWPRPSEHYIHGQEGPEIEELATESPTREYHATHGVSQLVRENYETSYGSEEEQDEYYVDVESDNRDYQPPHWYRPSEHCIHGRAVPEAEDLSTESSTRDYHSTQGVSQLARENYETSYGSEEEQDEHYVDVESDNRGYQPSHWYRTSEHCMHSHAGPETVEVSTESPTREYHATQGVSQLVRETSYGSEEEEEEYYVAAESDNRGYQPPRWYRPSEHCIHGRAVPEAEDLSTGNESHTLSPVDPTNQGTLSPETTSSGQPSHSSKQDHGSVSGMSNLEQQDSNPRVMTEFPKPPPLKRIKRDINTRVMTVCPKPPPLKRIKKDNGSPLPYRYDPAYRSSKTSYSDQPNPSDQLSHQHYQRHSCHSGYLGHPLAGRIPTLEDQAQPSTSGMQQSHQRSGMASYEQQGNGGHSSSMSGPTHQATMPPETSSGNERHSPSIDDSTNNSKEPPESTSSEKIEIL